MSQWKPINKNNTIELQIDSVEIISIKTIGQMFSTFNLKQSSKQGLKWYLGILKNKIG